MNETSVNWEKTWTVKSPDSWIRDLKSGPREKKLLNFDKRLTDRLGIDSLWLDLTWPALKQVTWLRPLQVDKNNGKRKSISVRANEESAETIKRLTDWLDKELLGVKGEVSILIIRRSEAAKTRFWDRFTSSYSCILVADLKTMTSHGNQRGWISQKTKTLGLP